MPRGGSTENNFSSEEEEKLVKSILAKASEENFEEYREITINKF